jgi:transposase
MQGKVMSEQSAAPTVDVGIDVCKDWLDIHILPAGTTLRVANNKKGHTQLLTVLRGFDVRLIAMEATGKYHRSIHQRLHGAGFGVAVVNPLRARLFAEINGLLAKTDTADAYALALMCATPRISAVAPLEEAVEKLKEIVRARETVISAGAALQNQLGAATLACVKKQIRRQLLIAERAAEALTAEAVLLVKADAGLARRLEILTSIPGIATVTALGLIVNMPELGNLDAKAAGQLAGLAPIARQSGPTTRPSHIRGGRPLVRTGIYMAAQSAARHNAQLKVFYDRLLGAGKQKKVAITAVMRKLIVLANTLLKYDRRWSPQAPIGSPLPA